MSRLSAALERATTGRVSRRRPPEPVPPDAPPAAEAPGAAVVVGPPVEDGQADERAEVPMGPVSDAMDDRVRPRFRGFNRAYNEKLIVSSAVPQPLREQYRRLAASLHHAQEESGLKTLMVTSAVPNEGKTLTATNIALTLSESYQRRVLLIDADLRRPSLDDVFQVPKVYGLREVLTSNPERKVSIVQVSQHLSLLTAGAPDPDPMSALTSERMKRLLAEAAAAFEWVIIDTPPVGILTDAKLLGAMVDGALVVIRAGKTDATLVQRSVDAIGRSKIVGVVLNRVDPRRIAGGDTYYSSYYHYYGQGGSAKKDSHYS
ncbi:MAG: CpsD/CapB family tyrosine-protein kinase [Acidimicrobiia bacterium]|nr:CpsD/CapB family tyrosine-protein kinase [Acidimicrobiia bacterium]